MKFTDVHSDKHVKQHAPTIPSRGIKAKSISCSFLYDLKDTCSKCHLTVPNDHYLLTTVVLWVFISKVQLVLHETLHSFRKHYFVNMLVNARNRLENKSTTSQGEEVLKLGVQLWT